MGNLEKPKIASAKPLEYHFKKEFKQLEKPTVRLVRKLKEAIDKEEYETLIGDDASGRAPTLVLRKIINNRIETLHKSLPPERKREKLRTYFVSGGQGLSDETTGYLKLFFESIRSGDKKFLLVTEYIQSGRSISKLVSALEASGINFDIASVFVDVEGVESIDKIQARGHRVFGGSQMSVPPKIWSHEGISGVVNLKTGPNGMVLEAHAVPLVKDPELMPMTEKQRLEFQQDINNSREDVKLLASRVVKQIWGK